MTPSPGEFASFRRDEYGDQIENEHGDRPQHLWAAGRVALPSAGGTLGLDGVVGGSPSLEATQSESVTEEFLFPLDASAEPGPDVCSRTAPG